jgi:Raf kinase inhibitor-like YbhB/YbcL family protein
MPFQLLSSTFAHGGSIPRRYTCDGQDLSPALHWSDAPAGTQSFALIMDDPDAPDPSAPKMVFVHWVLYNLPPGITRLKEGFTSSDLPAGAALGLNDWKRAAYGGPCPPTGRHRYFFKLYALDSKLPALGRPGKADLERAMRGHVLGEAVLIGTYQR